MVWRYIKAQLMVLLCGGLVGPIFLAVYFATGQSSLLKWMFYVGLLITAADVLIALARPLPSNRPESWRSPRSPAWAKRAPASTTSRW